MRNNKAMSLIEIIVSMVVLSVAALAVSSTLGLISSKKLRSSSGSLELQAASYARQTLEELKNKVSTNTAITDLTLGDHVTTPLTGDLAAAGGTRTYKVSEVAGTNLRKVTVTVTWDDP